MILFLSQKLSDLLPAARTATMVNFTNIVDTRNICDQLPGIETDIRNAGVSIPIQSSILGSFSILNWKLAYQKKFSVNICHTW